MKLGIANSAVQIVSYSDLWPQAFEIEKNRILKNISSHTCFVEHIGSTSIPGLSAKPIIDIGF